MSLSKRLLVFVILVFILSLSAIPVFATFNPEFVNATFYCDEVILTYLPGNFLADQTAYVSNSSGVISNGVTIFNDIPGPVSVNIPLNTRQAEGSALSVTGVTWIVAADTSGTCSGLLNDVPSNESDTASSQAPILPAYYQFGGEDAYMGMRVIANSEGSLGVVLLDISNDSKGTMMFYASANTIAEDYPCTGETYPIFQTNDEIHQFHRISTCEFQLSTGPDFEGKTHVIVFEGLPPQNMFEFTFTTD